MFNYIVVF